MKLRLFRMLAAAVLAAASSFGQIVTPSFQVASPSNGQVLQYNSATGTWRNVAISSVVSSANPSASAGLTAVNGTATTFMTSDSSPAINQAITPTWTGLHTFNNGVNVGGPSSGSNFASNPLAYVLRTSSASGIGAAFEADYNTAFTNTNIGVGFIGSVVDTGTASGGSNPHLIGALGIAANNSGSGIPINGLEGRVDDFGLSATDTGVAVLGIGNKVATVGVGNLNGRTNIVFEALPENTIGTLGGTSTPTGSVIDFYALAPPSNGGDPTAMYALLGGLNMQIKTGGTIAAANTSDGSKTISISHDGTNGNAATSSGKLRLTGASGNYEPAGSSGVDARLPGLLSEQTSATGIGNVSTGATTLMTYSLTGGTLASNGDSIRIVCDVQYANNTNSKTVTLTIGSTTIYNLAAAIQNGWLHINATVTRLGATSELITSTVFLQSTTATTSGTTTLTGSETLANPLTVKITGTGGASNDLLQYRQEIEYWPTP